MKIIVTVKVVPEEIMIDKETGRVIRENVKSIFNPLDLLAAEEGRKLKEEFGGELIAVSMAPPKESELLSTLFKYGFDRVILLTDRAFAGSDTIATAFVLSSAIKKLVPDYDLILQGDYSLDGATGQLGGEIAALLGIPFVFQAISVKMDESLQIERSTEESIERYTLKLPALVSVRRGINNGIAVNLFSLMDERKKGVEIYTNKELNFPEEKTGKSGSKTDVIDVIQVELPVSTELIKEGGAEHLADFLEKAGVV
jgi:electron transfer flavoprotein beta subunit